LSGSGALIVHRAKFDLMGSIAFAYADTPPQLHNHTYSDELCLPDHRLYSTLFKTKETVALSLEQEANNE
jgi:hypothetical protein